MDIANLLLLLLLAVGILGNNNSVAIAVTVLLLLRLLGQHKALTMLEGYGLHAGVILLTIGVLAPIATGKIGAEEMMKTFVSPAALLAIAIGMFVSYLGGRGVGLMSAQPLVVTGLMVGTILGVAFFRGVPVGPLIAAGMMSVVLGVYGLFQR